MKTASLPNGIKQAIITTALGLALLLHRESAAQTITDSFTNSANWGAPFTESGKNLVVTNGRMNFTSSTTGGGGGGIVRSTPFLTVTQDWSIQVDVHVDPFTILTEDHGVSVFLGIGKSSDWLGTHILLGFDRDWWYPGYYGVNDDVQVNGVSVPGFTNLNYLPSGDAAVRLDFNAANQTITYSYDADGASGGYNWSALGTTNIASGTYNLQLGPADTLSVVLGGWSDGHIVTNGQAYLDNLEITFPSTDYVPDSIAGYTVAGAITNINGTPIPPASATNIYSISTFSQIGPNADNTYSGTYTYVKTGAATGTIFITKTAPPDQAGETTTNYLVFNDPLSGTFAHHYDFVDTPPTVQYGTFQVVQTNGLSGSLQVAITPAGAVTAGAQWQVDGGAWQNSESTVADLTVGNHTVAYKTVSGWNTPTNQTVLVSAGATSVTNGFYVQQLVSSQDGLIAHLPLDGNANDVTTNGNHGTVYGAASITNRFGVPNAAYYFNGTDNYIRIPQSSSLSNLSTATISYWVKYHRTGIGDYQVSMTICNGQDRLSPPGIWTYATADRLMHFLGRQGGLSEHVDIPMDATAPLTQQPFVFVTFVVNSTNMLSYKNGILQGTSARQGLPIARPNYDWFLGTSGDFALFPYYLNGIMDDLRIYNRPLSEVEVWRLYSSEAGATNAAPVIISQPVSRTNQVGTMATFTVGAIATNMLSFQWRKDGENLSNGADVAGVFTETLSLAAVSTDDAGGYSVVVSNVQGSATSHVANLTIVVMPTLAEALDATELTWSSGGAANWQPQMATTHDGVDAAQSGPISHNQETWMQTTVIGPGTLSYWWKVSSESSYDYFEFYIDGGLQAGRISGEVNWQLKTNPIAAGTHDLRWRYLKDGSVNSGQDRAWLDQVTYSPSVTPNNAVHYYCGRITSISNPANDLDGSIFADSTNQIYTTFRGNYAFDTDADPVHEQPGIGIYLYNSLTLIIGNYRPVLTPAFLEIDIPPYGNGDLTITAGAFGSVNYAQFSLLGSGIFASTSLDEIHPPPSPGVFQTRAFSFKPTATSSVSGQIVALTTNPAPMVAVEPLSLTRAAGAAVTLTVGATGADALTYRWKRNNTNLLNGEKVWGVTNAWLVVTNLQPSDAGNYSVVITNTYGSVTSSVAMLTVQVPPLLIVSTNGSFGVSNGVFGFSLSGTAGQIVVTEAATNLANPIWVPLETNILTSDSIYLSDPQWTNFPGRFYRIRSP